MKNSIMILLTLCTAATGSILTLNTTDTKPEFLPEPITNKDFYQDGAPSTEKVELGRMLFFDKVLSGNRNISCATCHHPQHGSSDGLALPFGEGALGLGPDRRTGEGTAQAVHSRVPRNSPGLFNVGAQEFTRLFHDGRVETDPAGNYEGGFISPAKWRLPKGLDNPLAAQAMFPPTSDVEMAGQKGENPVADASSMNNAAGPGGVWELLAKRLQDIPEYVELFKAAYPESITQSADITFVDAANAIAAFEAVAFRTDNSPFDQVLEGNSKAISDKAREGMNLFYGKANCASCHSGKFQTDHDFHAIAMPQIGPGKNHGNNGNYWRASGYQGFVEDFGRGRVTFNPKDNYKFRTPSLRNVAETGPWGHAGAYDTLEAVIRHHLNPVESLEQYRPSEAVLPPLESVVETTAKGAELKQEFVEGSRLVGYQMRDTWVQNDPELRAKIAEANELPKITLTDAEVECLVEFLNTLTGTSNESLLQVPTSVPSGLTVID